MDDNRSQGKVRLWWRKYRRWVLLLLVLYGFIVVALIVLAGGPQREPFLYQIF
jgi:hypothetical protein